MKHKTATPESTAFFETTDFYLACYLRCLGYELADVRKQGRRSIFVFRDRLRRKEQMISFYNNEGSVKPLAFAGVIKAMKALLYNI